MLDGIPGDGYIEDNKNWTVRVTERGWPGHFCAADKCLFRRNTLIEGKDDAVVVSTVGCMIPADRDAPEEIGANGRYYETMVFGACKRGSYIEANTFDKRPFDSEWCICADSAEKLPEGVDNKANEQHDAVVAEFTKKLSVDK